MKYTHEDYAKAQQQHNKKMVKAGATTIYDIGDMTSIYTTDREKYGAFLPEAGYKQAKAPYEKMFASYDGEIVGESGKLLKTSVNNAGYEVLGVNLNGKHTTACVHRLVASSWLPNPEGLSDVDHLSGDRTLNRADALRWISHKENLAQVHRMKQMAGHKGAKNQGMPVVKVDADGTRTTYKSASAAAKSNNLSAVSVTGNAKGQLHINKPYHFELAQK